MKWASSIEIYIFEIKEMDIGIKIYILKINKMDIEYRNLHSRENNDKKISKI